METVKKLWLPIFGVLISILGFLLEIGPLPVVGLCLLMTSFVLIQIMVINAYGKKYKRNYYRSFLVAYAIYMLLLVFYITIALFAYNYYRHIGQNDILSLYSFVSLALLISSILFGYIFFLPYLIANKKRHPQTRAIYILNIFAGWTIIAWIIALVWANTESKNKPVPLQTVFQSGADELIKYKKLLDSGVITQEEFDAKKKQLLGL